MKYMFCMNCGYKLASDDLFCPECGVKVGEIEKTVQNITEPSNKCSNCGHEIESDDLFCPECGFKTSDNDEKNTELFADEKSKILEMIHEYDVKDEKARKLIGNMFTPTEMSYDRFIIVVDKCSNLFNKQSENALKIIEYAFEESPSLKNELNDKIKILDSIIDSLDELIEELILHLAENKNEEYEIEDLIDNMENLTDSVRKY